MKMPKELKPALLMHVGRPRVSPPSFRTLCGHWVRQYAPNSRSEKAVDRKRMFLLLTALHLLSFAALSAWVLLLIVAMLNRTVNEVAS